MKHTGPQFFHKQREHQPRQHTDHICVQNQEEASLGENRVWTQNDVAKWEKSLCSSGMKKMKLREEDYQMLCLPIDGKSSHRDQLFCVFIEDKMSKITDFIFNKEFLGLLLDKFPFCKDRRALEQRWHSWGWRVLAVPNACYTRMY